MLITGGHDYYDKAMSFGCDKSVIFTRESQRWLSDADVPVQPTKLFTLVSEKHHSIRVDRNDERYKLRSATVTLRPVTVIFCGEVFGGISVQEDGSPPNVSWLVEPFQMWLDAMGVRPGGRIGRQVDLNRYFYRHPASPELRSWLTVNGIVVAIRHAFVADAVTWQINSDGLKEVQFYKVVDIYSAYQAISMWLNSMTVKEPPAVVLTDADRIAKHGFDKQSFRGPQQKSR